MYQAILNVKLEFAKVNNLGNSVQLLPDEEKIFDKIPRSFIMHIEAETKNDLLTKIEEYINAYKNG